MSADINTKGKTIFALATPPGKSGVAVIRLSGQDSLSALMALTRAASPKPRYAELRYLYSPNDSSIIDHVLVLYFPAPHSFTGESIVEIHTHGSRAVIQTLLNILGNMPDLRLAEPGEFSRRALMYGKMDLTEIEGLADLIDAETEAQRRQALRLTEGHISKHYELLRSHLLHSLALLEAYIDFPDEEIPDYVWEEVRSTVLVCQEKIKSLLDDNHIGERIREGFTVVILGEPNVGKSSLLNALAKRDIAIVSPIAGTTRDMIELHVDIGGYAITFVDTAGLRDSHDEIEKEGIDRAKRRASNADIVIMLSDISIFSQDSKINPDQNTIVAINKCDSEMPDLPDHVIAVSAKYGLGIEKIVNAVKEKIEKYTGVQNEPMITRKRHRDALQQGLHHLNRFNSVPAIELSCEELRLAAIAIGNITGKILVDEVLDHIFKKFCIGK